MTKFDNYTYIAIKSNKNLNIILFTPLEPHVKIAPSFSLTPVAAIIALLVFGETLKPETTAVLLVAFAGI